MNKRVLIVDDSPIIRRILRKLLENSGYEVCGEGTNGKEGADLYKKLSPDVVLMDITMPLMDGVESLKKIIEFDKNANVIMLSAMGDIEITDEAINSGAKLFIKKPVTEDKIISALSKLFK